MFWFFISIFYFLFYFTEELGILDQADELHLFCLHFVFIPRLNSLLRHWAEAYNRHPLAREHNSTLQNSLYAAPGGVFDRDLVEGLWDQYGIDWEGPCPDHKADEHGVNMPQIDLDLSPNILQELQELIDLAHSELSGLDIILPTLFTLVTRCKKQTILIVTVLVTIIFAQSKLERWSYL